MIPRRTAVLIVCLVLLTLVGCNKVYYAAWEKLGYEKRDLLVSQVEATRKQQAETAEQFTSALDQFKESFAFDGGNIEKAYNKLNGQYEQCENEATRLRGEIADVESISKALFKEWNNEIDDQTNADYKRLMKDQRSKTLDAYNVMIGKMHDAEARIDPVLNAFRERTLMLKSSLNAKAIASLETDSQDLIGDIENLIQQMNESIAEADEFIASMSS